MKSSLIYIFILGLFLSSCSTERSALRYLGNHPDLIESMSRDTTIYIETEQTDTMFIANSDTVSLIDTFYHDKIRIIIKQDTSGLYQDSIFVFVPTDTVQITVPVVEYVIKNRVKAIPPWKVFLMYLGGLFSILIFLGAIHFIRKVIT